jgi:hypothetical protein
VRAKPFPLLEQGAKRQGILSMPITLEPSGKERVYRKVLRRRSMASRQHAQ